MMKEDISLSGELDRNLKVHIFPVRVYFEDTDTGGIVYHANYLKYAERARTEFLRFLGVSHASVMRNNGVMIAVHSCDIRFLKSAILDDILSVKTTIARVTRARLCLTQDIYRDETPLARLHLVLACVKNAGIAVRFPEEFIERLQPFDQSSEKKEKMNTR